VEQELFILPEFTPGFSGVCITRSLVLCVFVDRCLSFYPFLFTIVLSVLLRFTDSDYPFGIFKLFFSLRGKLWAHKPSLLAPPFIKVSVRSKESERSCIFVLEVSISTIMIFYFGIVPTVTYFFVFHFITDYCTFSYSYALAVNK